MRIDLFEDEQKIYDSAILRITQVKEGAAFAFSEYESLAKEYGKLLKQLRRSTRIADRTTFDLYESNLNLTDKIHYDALTGIYNRRFLEDNLKRVIKSLSRAKGELSVLMLDIDYFKRFNDTYGHSEGDVCLSAVARAIANSVTRTDDFVARYGGEEFAAVLPNTNESGARRIAEHILENVRKLGIPHKNSDVESCVTISIGVTTGVVTHRQSEVDYLKRADEALYLSKQQGRNRYTYLHLE